MENIASLLTTQAGTSERCILLTVGASENPCRDVSRIRAQSGQPSGQAQYEYAGIDDWDREGLSCAASKGLCGLFGDLEFTGTPPEDWLK